MSTKPKAAADAPRYDAARHYSVQLSRSVEYPPGSGRQLSPGPGLIELRGDVCEAIGDAVATADLVAEPPAAG